MSRDIRKRAQIVDRFGPTICVFNHAAARFRDVVFELTGQLLCMFQVGTSFDP